MCTLLSSQGPDAPAPQPTHAGINTKLHSRYFCNRCASLPNREATAHPEGEDQLRIYILNTRRPRRKPRPSEKDGPHLRPASPGTLSRPLRRTFGVTRDYFTHAPAPRPNTPTSRACRDIASRNKRRSQALGIRTARNPRRRLDPRCPAGIGGRTSAPDVSGAR